MDIDSPEGKAAIKAAVEEATNGLIKKRDELLNEVKTLRKNSEIKPEDYQALKDENDALNDKLAETGKALKLAQSDTEKATKALQAESAAVSKMLIDNGLTEAMTAAGVKPELAKAAKALFASQATIKADGETRAAVIGDKSLSDFVSEWSKTDEGKHFVSAPENSGGGANGGNRQNTTAKTMTRADFDVKSSSGESLGEFFKSGGVVVD